MKVEEQSQGDKHEFIEELKQEIMKLQAKTTELTNKVLFLTGEVLRSQKENKILKHSY